ncbi:MAG: lipopolysaccharide kinase InaA family protein [Gammaproteobacteria bacterium]
MFWHIVDYNAPLSLSSLKAVASLNGEAVTQAKTRDLIRVETNGQAYYIKRYWTAGKKLRKYLFRSRAKAEWENLQYFKHLKIPAPLLVSYGEYRTLFHYEYGAFVMRALGNVIPLDTVLAEATLPCSLRLTLLQQIAQNLRRLHDYHFIHGDCFVRNFLVSPQEAKVYFTDCPRGRHMWGPFFDYGRVRDLASFYKGVQGSLSLTDQLRFFLWYCGEPRLTVKNKKLLRKVIKRLGL